MTRLRLVHHRASLANEQAIYPFLAGGGLGAPGVFIGVDEGVRRQVRQLFGGLIARRPAERRKLQRVHADRP